MQHDVPPPLEDDLVAGPFEERDPRSLLVDVAEGVFPRGDVSDDLGRSERRPACGVPQ